MAVLNKQAKLIYWGTSGCASRTNLSFFNNISEQGSWTWFPDLEYLREDNVDKKEIRTHHHEQNVPPGYEDEEYKVVYMIRNPYTRFISGWLDIKREGLKSFEQYITEKVNQTQDHDWYFWEQWPLLNKSGIYPVRMENSIEDWLKIPEVIDTMGIERATEKANEILAFNPISENKYDEYDENGYQVVNKWFTQETADMIYDSCRWVFDIGGYDKDSWK